MRYVVTYLVAGEERTARLDAPDAATAAAAASLEAHRSPSARFELLRVRLLDACPVPACRPLTAGGEPAAS